MSVRVKNEEYVPLGEFIMVAFERDQVEDLKRIFKQYIPDIEINEIDR